MTEPARRYRLHLESQRRQSPPFHLHEAVWQAACARHPDFAQRIDVTFGWDGERFARPLDDVDFLLASRFPHDVVNDAPRLRWIHTTGAGVDQLMPLDRLRGDLIVTNSSGIHSDKATEYTQMALLMLNAQLSAVLQAQREHRWDAHLTTSIRGKTALIIGFGDLGMAASLAARALGLRVIALNRSGAASAEAVEAVDVLATISALDDWLPQADFVVITAPLTPETRDLLCAARLACMRPGAGVVNLSRAALIDHAALFERLHSGECGGALLDVFDPEPLPAEHVAWDVPRLVVTPHISCDAPDYNLRVLELWFGNFGRFLRDEPLTNIVDRTRGY
jgi:phosphoglycerate dehydrogenase-like enzyme